MKAVDSGIGSSQLYDPQDYGTDVESTTSQGPDVAVPAPSTSSDVKVPPPSDTVSTQPNDTPPDGGPETTPIEMPPPTVQDPPVGYATQPMSPNQADQLSAEGKLGAIQKPGITAPFEPAPEPPVNTPNTTPNTPPVPEAITSPPPSSTSDDVSSVDDPTDSTFDAEYQNALTEVNKYFELLDTAAGIGTEDGQIGRVDLQAAVGNPGLPADLKQACQFLLDNPAVFNEINAAAGGTDNGLITKADVEGAIQQLQQQQQQPTPPMIGSIDPNDNWGDPGNDYGGILVPPPEDLLDGQQNSVGSPTMEDFGNEPGSSPSTQRLSLYDMPGNQQPGGVYPPGSPNAYESQIHPQETSSNPDEEGPSSDPSGGATSIQQLFGQGMSMEEVIQYVLGQSIGSIDQQIDDTVSEINQAEQQEANAQNSSGSTNSAKSNSSQEDIEMLQTQLQDLVQQREQMFSLMSNMSQTFNQTAQTILANLGRA
jgi:hypothetical protein